MPAIGLIILAAGGSSRMGEPKQLLKHDGKTLITRAIEVASKSRCTHHVLVVGANASSIRESLDQSSIAIVENRDWAIGLSSSIALGLKTLLENQKQLDAAILMTCDQPFVMSRTLNDLIDMHYQTRKPIVACQYDGTAGLPALFEKTFFPALFSLNGDVGATAIIQLHLAETATIDVPEAAVDIDTPDDYAGLSVSS